MNLAPTESLIILAIFAIIAIVVVIAGIIVYAAVRASVPRSQSAHPAQSEPVFFVRQDDEDYGPYTAAGLAELSEAGQISDASMIRLPDGTCQRYAQFAATETQSFNPLPSTKAD